MPPTSPPDGTVRTRAVLNELIRNLWVGGVLPVERRPEYERLVVEWARVVQAEQRDVGEAA